MCMVIGDRQQQAHLLEESVQKGVKITQLEAAITQYRGCLECFRIQVQQQEHSS
jgi:hypothetical protein